MSTSDRPAECTWRKEDCEDSAPPAAPYVGVAKRPVVGSVLTPEQMGELAGLWAEKKAEAQSANGTSA